MPDDMQRMNVVRSIVRAAIDGGITAAAAPAVQFDLTSAAHLWNCLLRQARRTDVTLTVVQAWDGPPVLTQHPVDGSFIECSFSQAEAVDREFPLRLRRVVAPDRAEFGLAWPAVDFTRLFPPPYTLPETIDG